MKSFRLLYKTIFGFLGFCSGLALLFSCADESIYDVKNPNNGYNPALDPDMVMLPLGICYGIKETRSEDTRATGEFTDGSDDEHKMDFDTPNECYAIFFRETQSGGVKVKYIQPLYLNDQLGEGGKEEGSKSEYTITTVAYIPKEDTEEVTVNGNKMLKPKLTKVLVVLNGRPMYKKISETVQEIIRSHPNSGDPASDDESYQADDLYEIFSLTWSNAAAYSGNDQHLWNLDREDSDGRIGFNSKGLYTMTNSTYYEYKNGKYILHNASEIEGYAYSTIQDYLDYINYKDKQTDDEEDNQDNNTNNKNPENRGPSTSVYVERMVAKFMSPTFSTEVIGSDRVFRPAQDALPLVVYTWDENNHLVSDQKNWRIHLLGWAINGDESETYIFKQLPTLTGEGNQPLGKDWNVNYWNDFAEHRSYWSIDPHYSSDRKQEHNDFYPWQIRKAADRNDIISMTAALAKREKIPVLRYNSFNDVLNEWMWRDALHVHENTFDPFGDWYDEYQDESKTIRNDNYLDGRPSMLAGPHLLIVGEVYLDGYQGENGYLNNQFGPVEHLYSDRVRRYYTTEADWFKMFVREFNRSLSTQEKMTFPVFDWDERSDGKANKTYVVSPSGECRIYLRHPKDYLRYYDKDGKLRNVDDEAATYPDPDYNDLENTEITYKIVDYLTHQHDVKISSEAYVRTGDGRLIPWLSRGENAWNRFGLVVRNPKGQKLSFQQVINDSPDGEISYDWNDDMLKSLFYEWFGPIDHYYKGYMYYAGEIKHHIPADPKNGTTFYGTVRNHKYSFRVEAINSLGTPVDDPDQLIIPGHYNYRDQIIVNLNVIGWHPAKESVVDFQ